MSGRGRVGRVLVAVAAMLMLGVGLSSPTVGQAVAPLPQATTTASPTPSPPSSTASDPADEPVDDGSNPMPAQTGTWAALGAAAALAVTAGLLVALRKR